MTPSPEQPASFVQIMRAVAWSFFGIRRSADLERNTRQLRPVHLIVGGLIGAVVFVFVLVLMVRWIISSGVAG